MQSIKVTVCSKSGLHARPAANLAKLCQKFKSSIQLKANDKSVNPKSIIGILSLGVPCGTEVGFTCEGPDEEEAAKAIAEAVNSGLGE